MSHGITPEPPAGSEHYREGWRDGYEQKGLDMAALADASQKGLGMAALADASQPFPAADWSGSWAELTGYVDAARLDRGQINPVLMLQYMAELKHKALAPVREWMQSVMDGKG